MMFNLPEKKSQKWYFLIGIVLVINLVTLLASRFLVGQTMTLQNVIGFGIISTVLSLFVLPGYFGFHTYTLAVLLGDLSGLGYMLYQIFTRKNDGWVDITSIFSFLSLVVIGIITGIIAQVVWVLSSKK